MLIQMSINLKKIILYGSYIKIPIIFLKKKCIKQLVCYLLSKGYLLHYMVVMCWIYVNSGFVNLKVFAV